MGTRPVATRRPIPALVCLLVVSGLAAQSPAFEDLARQASESIDTDPGRAVELYRQALALRPDWAEGWMYRGAALFELRRYPEARDALLRGVAIDSRKGTPYAFLGMVDYELGDYPRALADILKGEAIGLPDNPGFLREVRARAASVYLRSDRFGEAMAQLAPLARRNIESGEVTTLLGLGALGLHYLPATIPADRASLVELAGRAAWLFLQQRYEEAAPFFQQLGTRFPDDPGVHYAIGVFLSTRDRPAAEREFRHEMQISPSNVLARIQLANLLRKRGATAEALQLAREAVRLTPTDALCQSTLGRTLLEAGRTSEAIGSLQKAEKLAPQAAKVHLYLLQAYRRAGRVADAQREKASWERLRAEEEPALAGGELERWPRPTALRPKPRWRKQKRSS